ncbi:MAG: DUF4126 domain-containing protein [Gemmatimonadetes bacterium]|nr:DUF4126 domain-containing protein [Gemmatimonadota bacterium]
MALARALGLAVGAGVNLYATVLVLGLAARYEWVALPEAFDPLASSWVIGVAGALYAVEFLADKVPWIDTAWDLLHTLVRPIGAAVIAVTALGPADPGMQTMAAVLGGAIGASAHAAKAGTRLAVNTSPEPVTNIGASLLEDGFVVGLVVLLITYPWIGVAVAGLALTAVAVIAVLLVRLWRRRRTGEPTATSAR